MEAMPSQNGEEEAMLAKIVETLVASLPNALDGEEDKSKRKHIRWRLVIDISCELGRGVFPGVRSADRQGIFEL